MPETLHKTKTFRFDEMAVLVKDKINNPAEADVDRYVGLEHLDPKSLKIRRWGAPTDVEATKLVFKAGDIIFGKRRVYQRKLAVADFDGICSAHAMVLRAKPEVVLPEFLPFFMQSDLFMERALEISVGSLSPTINWKTLAKEEFALPPLEEQRRIVRALDAVETAVCLLVDARLRLRDGEIALVDGFLQTLRTSGVSPTPLAQLSLGKPTYGLNAPATDFQSDLPRYLRITDIDDDGRLSVNDIVSVKTKDPGQYRIKAGDLLFARTGNTVGKVYLAGGDEGNVVYAGYLIRFALDTDRVDPRYVFAWTRSTEYRMWVRQKRRVGAQPNINAKEFGDMPVLVPLDTSSQSLLVQKYEAIREARYGLGERLRKLASLKKRIIATGGIEGEHRV